MIVGRLGAGSVAQGKFFGRVRLGGIIRDILSQLLPELEEDRLDQVSARIRESFGPFQRESVIGLTPNLTASRLANRLGLGGVAYTVDAACASSLIAVSNALAELESGRLDAAVVGGVHHMHDMTFWSMFSQLGALSRRGEIRPFDQAADGLLIGEATGMVVLKRLADARRVGDRIYAVIRGAGTSSDGRTASLFNPDTAGQTLAVRRAWASAGLDPTAPDAIGLLEAHGTATPAGDAAELATVAQAFGPGRDGPGSGGVPVIGSVKSMIGHTMAAAGIVSLIKTALAVSKGVLPPTLHCDAPHPSLAATRFAPIAQARDWEGPGPRRAAVNAFGFGGINAHVVLEEVPAAAPARRAVALGVSEPTRAVLLAGPNPEALSVLLDAGDDLLREPGKTELVTGPGTGCRLGIVDPTSQRLATARDLVARGQAWRGGAGIWFSPRPLLADGAGQVAFVFSGLEGDFHPQLAGVREQLGLAVHPEDPVEPPTPEAGVLGVEVLRTGLLMHDALRRLGVTPDVLAGYSLGEWAAWAAADITDRAPMYRLAALEPASAEVSVVVVAAGGPDIEPRLAGYPGVALSVDSAPNQSLLCGPAEAMGRLIADLRQEGILSQPVPLRAGYHTAYFRDGAAALSAAADWTPRPGHVPVWSATSAAPLPDDPAERRALFFRHLTEPVRFRETIAGLYEAGVRAFIQVGSGHLASVMREGLRGRDHLAIEANTARRGGVDQLRRLGTALWVEGLAPDLAALGIQAPSLVRSARRSQPIELQLSWTGISLGADADRLLGPVAPVGPSIPASTASSPFAAALGLLRTAVTPGARELADALEDTAVSVAGVLSAGEARAPAAQPAPPANQTAPTSPTPSSSAPQAQPTPRTLRVTQRLSLADQPYLRDHCFFDQPEGWPHAADRWPVVPGAAICQYVVDAVEGAVAGAKVTGLSAVRFDRWVLAEPAKDVEITMEPVGDAAYRVSYGRYARMLVHTAAGYRELSAPWPSDGGPDGRLREGISFLGPSYQGIDRITELSERQVRSEGRVPASPGALLDCGLQLVGQWLYQTQAHRKLALPMSIGAVSFAGAVPPAGTSLTIAARIDSVDNDEVRCSIQYSCGGRVWAQLDGARLKRFESEAVLADPSGHFFAERQPGGWVAAVDLWSDAMSVMLIANQTLGAAGHAEYERQPLRDRRPWLLTRLAVKDAVRLHLRDVGTKNVFPIEVAVTDGVDGRPEVSGWVGRPLDGYRVSAARAGKMAVALAAPGGPGVGISIVKVNEADGAEAARFAAAREAVSRAAGAAGLIVEATPDEVAVEVGGQRYLAGLRQVTDPGETPPGRYVVAWTWGAGRDPENRESQESERGASHGI